MSSQGMSAEVGSWNKAISGRKEVWRGNLCDPLEMEGRGSYSRWSAAEVVMRPESRRLDLEE